MHSFDDDLAFSHSQADAPWWSAVYQTAFPDLAAMVSVRKDGWAQRGGIDRVLTLESGKTLYVDEKVRREDWPDFALEYWSDKDKRVPGWVAKDLACDYIAYAFVPSATCYLLPFQELRRAWRLNRQMWVGTYTKVVSENPSWTTISVAVPRDVVLSALSSVMRITWAPEPVAA